MEPQPGDTALLQHFACGAVKPSCRTIDSAACAANPHDAESSPLSAAGKSNVAAAVQLAHRVVFIPHPLLPRPARLPRGANFDVNWLQLRPASTHHVNRAGLRTHFPMRKIEADFRADLQLLERRVHDGVAVEININPAAIGDEAVIAEQLRDQRTRLDMCLYLVALTLHEILQLALHRFKCVVDDLGQRLVHLMLCLLFVRDELMTGRNGQIDADTEWIAGTLLLVRLLDRYVAAADMIAEAIEPRGFAADQIINFSCFLNTTVRDFDR